MDTLVNTLTSRIGCPEQSARNIALSAGEVMTFNPGRPECFHIAMGSVWITQDGHKTDWIIRQGESWTSKGKGKIVIQGLG